MLDHTTLAIMIPILGIGTGALAIFLSHLQKIEQIRANNRNNAETSVGNNRAIAEELQALRRELEILRDTSTRFDVSFDAGLTRLEERVNRVEGNQYGTSQYGQTTSTASAADRPDVLTVSSRG